MYYKVGGSLPYDHPSYIEREADRQLYNALHNTKYCYVLNPRQMGKSSLKVRVKNRLEEEGFICVDIDLSIMGGRGVTQEQWYKGLTGELSQVIQPSIDIEDWWDDHSSTSPQNRFYQFITEVLLNRVDQNIIIFLDEIDGVLSLEFKDEFFTFIRACYNARANNSDYQRLTYCLIGVATPSQLIQSSQTTPFNIGRRIELKGFSLQDTLTPLEEGLRHNTSEPRSVLENILFWTGGQPFLTQKICKLIESSPNVIPCEEETEEVANLVKEKVINNWQYHDQPQHFQTIQGQLLRNEESVISVLELYKRVYENETIQADATPEQIKLKLSGLVIEDQGKLKIFNPIYQKIFTIEWANKKLEEIRPYAQKLKLWYESNRQKNSHLLRGEELETTLRWKEKKRLDQLDHDFIAASQELVRKETVQNLDEQTNRTNTWQFRASITSIIALILLTGIGGSWYFFKTNFCHMEYKSVKDKCILKADLKGTSGDKTLLSDKRNDLLDFAVKYFKEEDYENAKSWFEKAKETDKQNPIPHIYLNNTKARQKENADKIAKIAVVVPIRYRVAVAQEILRGVVDAQRNYNNNQIDSDDPLPLLEVVIYDDQNDLNIAPAIAEEIARDKSILAVVGHVGSDLSLKAMREYQKEKVVIITPTSTSPDLDNKDYVYRPLPSDTQNGEELAKYVKQNLGENPNVLVFYDSKSNFSENFTGAFVDSFKKLGGKIVNQVDITNEDINLDDILNTELEKEELKAIILLPGIKTLSSATAIAIKNSQEGFNKDLFGNDAMYNPYLLCEAGEEVENLVLPIPWHIDNISDGYKKSINPNWRGSINWRTAMAYDSTVAITKSLSKNPTRKSISDNIKKVDLDPKKTSGDHLKFRENGNPDDRRKTRFVQVTRNALNSPSCSKFGFELIE